MRLFYALLLAAHLAAPRTTLISRAVVGNHVYVTYDIASGPYPLVAAPGGYADLRLVQDDGGWRGRVYAVLELCGGSLLVDGVTVTQQRCQWVPVVTK